MGSNDSLCLPPPANLRFVYPQIPNIEIVTAPGCVYIVSTIEDGRHMVLYCQRYVHGFPGASRTVLKNIYRRSVREVRARIKQMQGSGSGVAGCACADPEKCRCLNATADRQWRG